MPESRFCSCHDDATLSSTLERHDDAFVCANRVAQTQGVFVRGICGTFLPAAAPCCTRTGYEMVRHRHAQRAPNNVPAARGLPLRLPRLSPRRNADPHCVPFLEPCTALCAGTSDQVSSSPKSSTPAVSQGVSLALMGKNCCWGGKRESSAKIHFYPKSGSKIPICPPFLGLNQHDYIFAHLARIISQTVSAEVVLVRLSPSANCR